MVGVPNPGECADCTGGDSEIRENSYNKNGVVKLRAVTVGVDDLQHEPTKTRKCTTAMDSSEVL